MAQRSEQARMLDGEWMVMDRVNRGSGPHATWKVENRFGPKGMIERRLTCKCGYATSGFGMEAADGQREHRRAERRAKRESEER